MGSLQAQEMARLTDLDTALRWHLQSNHHPSVALSMLEPCKQAIAAFFGASAYKPIPLPDGMTWRGQDAAPADAIVAGFHLEAFLDCEDDDEEGGWFDAMTGEPAKHDEDCLTLCDIPNGEKCRSLHSCWCSRACEEHTKADDDEIYQMHHDASDHVGPGPCRCNNG